MKNRTEVEEILRKIKFCMRRHLLVNYGDVDYYVLALRLKYKESRNESGFYYTVELADEKRVDSTITVGLDDVDWPTEGGGYRLE